MKTTKQLQEEIARLQKLLKESVRKDDSRYKMLLANAILRAKKQGAVKKEYIKQLLDSYITKRSDREFLGLEAIEPSAPHQQEDGTQHLDDADFDNNDSYDNNGQNHQYQEYQYNQ